MWMFTVRGRVSRPNHVGLALKELLVLYYDVCAAHIDTQTTMFGAVQLVQRRQLTRRTIDHQHFLRIIIEPFTPRALASTRPTSQYVSSVLVCRLFELCILIIRLLVYLHTYMYILICICLFLTY